MSAYYIEGLGYVASFIILVSLTMKSIVKLRWINAAGSALFVLFAFLTRSTPTVVMNLGIIFIDLWYVSRMSRAKSVYELVPAEQGSAYLDFFYRQNKVEIDETFGPDALAHAEGFSYFVCDNEIAGLFAWKENSPTECRIMIDFVTPRYRDTKIGSYFFEKQLPSFRNKGYTRFVYSSVGQKHWKYLGKIGFHHDTLGNFFKEI
jgi:hypothetical protein